MQERNGAEAVARVLVERPDRVAAAWRRLRYAQGKQNEVPSNLLDPLVEPFVREIGAHLAGSDVSPWSRTVGVLRISPERGIHALYDEFATLRRCLQDAVEVLGGGPRERALVNIALDEAVDSAIALARQLDDPSTEPPLIPFGGLVVEFYERAAPRAQVVPDETSAPLQ